MKKIVKVLIVLLIIFSYTSYSFVVQATDPITNPNAYKPEVENGISPLVSEFGGSIFSMIKSLGMIVAVFSLVLIGLNFIFGSPDKKAEYVQRLVPFVVGSVMLTALLSIIDIFYKTFTA